VERDWEFGLDGLDSQGLGVGVGRVGTDSTWNDLRTVANSSLNSAKLREGHFSACLGYGGGMGGLRRMGGDGGG
jgi:hypothetical protein